MAPGISWLMMSLVVLVLQLPNKIHSQSDFTNFNYPRFNRSLLQDFILQGDARLLTRDIGLTGYLFNDSVGRLLYSPPIRLWDRAGRRQATFQTQFRCFLGVEGQGVAFFIAPVNATFPADSSGGNLGLYNPSTGLSPVPVVAAEFDVFHNTWDPNYPVHLGININNRRSSAVAKWDAEPMHTGQFWVTADIRVTYDSNERLMTLDVTNSLQSQTTARVEHTVDLKTHLPEWVQIGISASTGIRGYTYYTSIHDVSSWSFISFMLNDKHDHHQYTSTAAADDH